MTMAEPSNVCTSPGIRRPVAFWIWSIGEIGRGAGRPSVTVPEPEAAAAETDMPNRPDTTPHPAATILPGDAISAPAIVASGSRFNMSLDTGPAEVDEESMDCATISA